MPLKVQLKLFGSFSVEQLGPLGGSAGIFQGTSKGCG